MKNENRKNIFLDPKQTVHSMPKKKKKKVEPKEENDSDGEENCSVMESVDPMNQWMYNFD